MVKAGMASAYDFKLFLGTATLVGLGLALSSHTAQGSPSRSGKKDPFKLGG